MTKKVRQTIDTSEADRKYVARFEEAVKDLCDGCVEMMETNPSFLLSPVFRKMMADSARRVREMADRLSNRLRADNPGEDFQ